MGSLDVDALFTSIPLDETISIGVEELFSNSNEVQNLSKKEVYDLLNLATKESLFIFNGDYYYQTDGVAMGSPLGPTLADLFMSYYEQIWLDECPLEFKPKYYRRYVDDVFILVEKIEHVGKFKEYLNSKHQNINFTSEIECDGKMPFLDNLIDRKGGSLSLEYIENPLLLEFILITRVSYPVFTNLDYYRHCCLDISLYVLVLHFFIWKSLNLKIFF